MEAFDYGLNTGCTVLQNQKQWGVALMKEGGDRTMTVENDLRDE